MRSAKVGFESGLNFTLPDAPQFFGHAVGAQHTAAAVRNPDGGRLGLEHGGQAAVGAAQLGGALGHPVFLSASNKRFLWELAGVDRTRSGEATMAAHALGIALGCRVLRAHDARAARRVADTVAAVLEAA